MLRVVVSGLGLVSSLGKGVNSNWNALCALPGTGPNLKGGDALGLSPDVGFSGLSHACDLAKEATLEALQDAGLWDGQSLKNVDPAFVGCTVSASKPLFHKNVPYPPDLVNEDIVRHFGLQGESRNIVAACATGAY